MERLTKKLPDGRNILTGNFAYVRNPKYGSFVEGYAVDKLAEYEDAEEQGLLLRLPCNVGDKVYRFWYVSDTPYRIQEQTIKTLTNIVAMIEDGVFGKTVFLTRKEAEAALKQMGG